MQRVNTYLYLIYMGFSGYYCGKIKIFTDLKAGNYLSFYKKYSSESYWVKKLQKFKQKDLEKKEIGIKRTHLNIFNFRKI